MRTLRVWLFCLLAGIAVNAIVWVPVIGLMNACATKPQRTTVNTLFATGKRVDAAFKSYLDAVIAKQLPTNDVQRISQLYTDFQTAFSTAVALSTLNTNAPPTPDVLNTSDQLLLAIRAVQQFQK